MSLKARVNVCNASGRWILAVHRERAESMLLTGEATFLHAGLIEINQTSRVTSEMARGPFPLLQTEIKLGQHHSSIHPQLHPRGTVRQRNTGGDIVERLHCGNRRVC